MRGTGHLGETTGRSVTEGGQGHRPGPGPPRAPQLLSAPAAQTPCLVTFLQREGSGSLGTIPNSRVSACCHPPPPRPAPMELANSGPRTHDRGDLGNHSAWRHPPGCSRSRVRGRRGTTNPLGTPPPTRAGSGAHHRWTRAWRGWSRPSGGSPAPSEHCSRSRPQSPWSSPAGVPR